MRLSRKKDKVLAPEQREKKRDQAQQRKFRNMAYKELLKMAKESPEIMRVLIEKEFDIKLPKYDPLKESEQELQKLIIDSVKDDVHKDPTLRERLALTYLHNNAEKLGIQVESPEVRLERQNIQIDQVMKIMERLGVKTNPSIWDTFKDPAVISHILQIIGMLVAARRGVPTQEENKIYMVEVNDKLVEMTPAQYQNYKLTNSLPQIPDAEKMKPLNDPIPLPGIEGVDIAKTKIQPDKHSNN